MFGTLDKVYKFFANHPKRQYALSELSHDSSSKLKSLCQTRWLQRIDAFHVFMDMFPAIIKTFDSIVANGSEWSRDAVLDTGALMKCMLNFEFILALHTIERYISYTEGLTRLLQARAIDLIQAVQHVTTLKQVLTDARTDVENHFHIIFDQASRHAAEYDVQVKTPRRCSVQATHDKQLPQNAEEYYRASLTIPFLDYMVTEIEDRFDSHSVMAMKCLGIIPSCFHVKDRASDKEMLDFFREHIPHVSTFEAELKLWYEQFKGREPSELPDTPQASLRYAHSMAFPTIRKILIQIMVLPVTTCEAERSFSALRRIKTYLRSTMSQERLSGLALLNVHQSANLPSTEAIRCEFLKKNRRIMEQRLI